MILFNFIPITVRFSFEELSHVNSVEFGDGVYIMLIAIGTIEQEEEISWYGDGRGRNPRYGPAPETYVISSLPLLQAV